MEPGNWRFSQHPPGGSSVFCFHPVDQIKPDSLCFLQMSSYKRATLEEEEASDAPAEAASSPDRVEVSEQLIKG